eukprot:CAMPEP_0177753808 /NCGR_PEP_ID=MMETSP0491_2-20121128/1662_1 /TAXON_ID=63592 /ORGANISM="Tetraselmis chuii, Strain PLY429" /LENGTH=40 /DNA_ID= /DNA_START= /DNA_END= /DNA_ORIENTATION=
MPVVELRIFMNDYVTDSPLLVRAKGAPAPSVILGGLRRSK